MDRTCLDDDRWWWSFETLGGGEMQQNDGRLIVWVVSALAVSEMSKNTIKEMEDWKTKWIVREDFMFLVIILYF